MTKRKCKREYQRKDDFVDVNKAVNENEEFNGKTIYIQDIYCRCEDEKPIKYTCRCSVCNKPIARIS